MPRIYKRSQDRIVRSLKRGGSFKASCNAAGHSESGVRELMEREPEFEARVLQARGQAKLKVENGLHVAATVPDASGRRDTKAGLEWLYNQASDEWANRRQVTEDVFVHDEKAVKDRQAKLGDAARAKLGKIAKEVLTKPPPGEIVH